MLSLVCVIGPVSSGKSTIINRSYPAEGAVRFMPGRIIREAAGTGFMAKDQAPNAPSCVDGLVMATFQHMARLAVHLHRPLVCDGFPRTVAQALAMRDTLELLGYSTKAVVVGCFPDEKLHRFMLRNRNTEDFDSLRMESSREDSQKVLEHFSTCKLTAKFTVDVIEADYKQE